MKKAIFLLMMLTVSVASFAQKGKTKMHHKKAITTQQVKYTCSMHPEVLSNKPGKCTKCGMDLTAVKPKAKKG